MYQDIINLILETMKVNKYKIVELENTEQIKQRISGKTFSLNNHVEGLIWSMLSNQRPWKGISDNKNKIRKIFHNFDYNYIMNENPDIFIEKLTKIKCGNRAIKKQMESLNYNINKFIEINTKYETIDNFITSDSPYKIANILSKGKYKLKQIGIPLAMEYLRNVGIDAIKPDLHICRILGIERLGFSKYISAKEAEAVEIINVFSKETNLTCSQIDHILWQFCASGYGEICTKNPKCEFCKVQKYCNYKGKL